MARAIQYQIKANNVALARRQTQALGTLRTPTMQTQPRPISTGVPSTGDTRHMGVLPSVPVPVPYCAACRTLGPGQTYIPDDMTSVQERRRETMTHVKPV